MRRQAAVVGFVLGSVVLLACEEARAEGEAALKLPLGLQEEALYIPSDNPLTAEKIDLGRLLYFDKRLSTDSTVSCASCHHPRFGFGDGQPVSTGVKKQKGARSAPTTINRAFSKEQFWDGRAADLEEQAKGPIANPIEMGFTHDGVVARLKGIRGYREQFEKVFGTENLTIDRVAQAIAAYERTILSGNSPYDRFQAGDKSALSAAAQRGFALFEGKASCVRCHTGFNFADEGFHNLGVGWDAKKKELRDTGRFQVTQKDQDKGAFKTPTLRDSAETAPYMHDGSQKTLEEVVEFYNKGGESNPFLDPQVKPLSLTAAEKKDLVEFLRALTGEIAADATTEPKAFPE